MRLWILTFVIISITLFVGSCGKSAKEQVNNGSMAPSPKATATPDEFAFARANYAKHCSNCHGPEGKGGLVTVENVKLKVPSLCEGHALKHADEDFVDQIANGGHGMPKFKDKLSPEEIGAMVHCIRHDFQGK